MHAQYYFHHKRLIIPASLCSNNRFSFRYQFFLQVKRDILQGRLPVQFDLSVELAAYAAQCKCVFFVTLVEVLSEFEGAVFIVACAVNH